jgi:hypothetical protein
MFMIILKLDILGSRYVHVMLIYYVKPLYSYMLCLKNVIGIFKLCPLRTKNETKFWKDKNISFFIFRLKLTIVLRTKYFLVFIN